MTTKTPTGVWYSANRRYFNIVFFVLGGIGLSYLVQLAFTSYVTTEWEAYSEVCTSFYLQTATESFDAIQNETRQAASRIATYEPIVATLRTSNPDKVLLHDLLKMQDLRGEVGVEIYSKRGRLLAWEGQSGREFSHEVSSALQGKHVSSVDKTAVLSQLIVAVPIMDGASVNGVALVRRVIEVNYPVENRFIQSEGLSDRLSMMLGVDVQYDFSEGAEFTERDMAFSGSLWGLDSTRVGVITVSRPILTGYLETIDSVYSKLRAILFAILILLLATLVVRSLFTLSSLALRSIAMVVVLWTARYLLLLIEFPSILFQTGLFDPLYFASQFGFGIVKSIGEMTITSITLAMSIAIVTSQLLSQSRRQMPWYRFRSPLVRFFLGFIVIATIFFLLRGYSSVIRSAVFDSTLNFTDPRVIVPSTELAFMVLNLFIISFCLIVVVAGAASFLLSLLPVRKSQGRADILRWFLIALLFVLGAILFGLFHPSPLSSAPYRVLFGVAIVGFTYLLHRNLLNDESIATVRNFLLALLLSGLVFYPILDSNVTRKDRDRVEVFAAELLRPADSWMKYIVDESLLSFAQGDAANVLRFGAKEEIERLAFGVWAQSSISKGGYTCLFQVIDPSGILLSQFKIGNQEGIRKHVGDLPLEAFKARSFGEREETMKSAKVYAGTASIVVDGDSILAFARVFAVAAQKSFTRENPVFMQRDNQETIETFYRRIIVSEYRNGILAATANNPLSVEFRFRDDIRSALLAGGRNTLWVDEEIGGREYETFYHLPPSDDEHVISLTVEKLDVAGRLYNVVKMLVYYALIISALLLTIYLVRWARGKRYIFSFRDKLLFAFLLTALVPVLIIGIYGRHYAEEEFLESIAENLEKETATVGKRLMAELSSGGSLAPFLNIVVGEELPQLQLLADYNLFIDATLAITNRPELFKAGMLDTRLSGSAFANVVLRGKRFFLQSEQIGQVQYVVGYRPLLREDGTVLGVVSVPSLYQLDTIERKVAARNALLFGVLSFVFLSIAVIATALANRIAAPIHRLTEATKRVARGDLDVVVKESKSEGEVGELIRSFGAMTRELKNSREDLVRFEREMAWKEMAKQVAHEIKNPLTPMKLSVQHLRQVYQDRTAEFGKVFEDVSKTLVQQIDELSRIASEFSHFARMPKRREELCDVAEVIRSAVALFEQDRHLTFKVDLPSSGKTISADKDELRRAFINILRNSSQAVQGHGVITIHAEAAEAFVQVSIHDNGSGIPEEIKGRLFEPNFSTKTDGMGLGLAIVKKTIDEIGGAITIVSSPGNGTTVNIKLPISPGQEENV